MRDRYRFAGGACPHPKATAYRRKFCRIPSPGLLTFSCFFCPFSSFARCLSFFFVTPFPPPAPVPPPSPHSFSPLLPSVTLPTPYSTSNMVPCSAAAAASLSASLVSLNGAISVPSSIQVSTRDARAVCEGSGCMTGQKALQGCERARVVYAREPLHPSIALALSCVSQCNGPSWRVVWIPTNATTYAMGAQVGETPLAGSGETVTIIAGPCRALVRGSSQAAKCSRSFRRIRGRSHYPVRSHAVSFRHAAASLSPASSPVSWVFAMPFVAGQLVTAAVANRDKYGNPIAWSAAATYPPLFTVSQPVSPRWLSPCSALVRPSICTPPLCSSTFGHQLTRARFYITVARAFSSANLLFYVTSLVADAWGTQSSTTLRSTCSEGLHTLQGTLIVAGSTNLTVMVVSQSDRRRARHMGGSESDREKVVFYCANPEP